MTEEDTRALDSKALEVLVQVCRNFRFRDHTISEMERERYSLESALLHVADRLGLVPPQVIEDDSGTNDEENDST